MLSARRPSLYPAPGRNPARGTARAGLSLVELTVAMAVMAVAMTAFSRSLVSQSVRTQAQREMTTAVAAARGVLERLQSEPFHECFARYNSDPADDPEGPGTAPGALVDVPGLRLLPGDLDAFAGEIVFPAVSVAGALQLREDADEPALGLPSDLNGDGVLDALDHAGDYVLLPVSVRISWRGAAGPARVEFKSILVEY